MLWLKQNHCSQHACTREDELGLHLQPETLSSKWSFSSTDILATVATVRFASPTNVVLYSSSSYVSCAGELLSTTLQRSTPTY